MFPSPLHRFGILLPSLLIIEAFLFFSAGGLTVTHLPGFDGPLPFHLQTGYLSVDDEVELFYYFMESERNPTEDPLILWLTGGPGCSAFSGLVFEIGPLKFVTSKYDGSIPSLLYNPYSWSKIGNIIFLDAPVGTGFSFSRFSQSYEIDDTTSSRHIYEALLKWYHDHPKFRSNPLYVAGDSYAGKIVPIVAHKITQGNLDRAFCNLKGYFIGNPVTGELVDHNSQVPFAHGVGIISTELFVEINGHCEGEDYDNPDPMNSICFAAINKFKKIISEVNNAHVLEPKCLLVSPKPVKISRDRSLEEENIGGLFLPPEVPEFYCRSYAYYLSYYWANNNATREALHIKEGTVTEWVRCNNDLPYTKNVASNIEYHRNLTRSGYRALVYSGDQDMVVSNVGTQAWIKSLNFNIVDDWRSWHVDGQVAGYTRKYDNNLTFATVKNAGHTAPEYQPRNCLVMLSRWISQDRL